MTDISPRLSVPIDRPVDPPLLEILHRADAATRSLGIGYFVAGALARDLILLHVFGVDTGRATRDVDLGICIDDWRTLDLLKATLIRGGNFSAPFNVACRLVYHPKEGACGIPLDLLPFGEIESTDATLAWPPGMDVVMNVAGFAEAQLSALMLEIADGFVVPVASLPSLAGLKLLAWRDRYLETSKDATDFLLLARHYVDAGNFERLYETESALLEATGFDPEMAGAMLLGKDAAVVCPASEAQRMVGILADPQARQRLEDQLLRSTLSSGDDAGSSRIADYLDAFRRGLML